MEIYEKKEACSPKRLIEIVRIWYWISHKQVTTAGGVMLKETSGEKAFKSSLHFPVKYRGEEYREQV